MKSFLNAYGLFFAWLISLLVFIVTLFLSEVLQWSVCPLCWYQRIAIYPLVILLGMAAYKNERVIIPYAIPFSLIGFFFAAYQYLEQMIPGFSPIEFCKATLVTCSAIHMKIGGFITLPFLSMLSCLCIFLLLMLSRATVHRP